MHPPPAPPARLNRSLCLFGQLHTAYTHYPTCQYAVSVVGRVQKEALTRDKIVLDFRVQGGEALLYARRPRQEAVPPTFINLWVEGMQNILNV